MTQIHVDPKLCIVRLTPRELREAAYIGVNRHVESLMMRRHQKHGLTDAGATWDMDVEGAAAEFAVKKALGLAWDKTIGTFKAADLGANIQVRSTQLPNGCLLIRKDDNPAHVYVLVVGRKGVYRIAGWVKGDEGRRAEWWSDKGGRQPAYFVPQFVLRHIGELTHGRNIVWA